MKEIAIVIPTKGRSRKLFPLLWNIVQTTPVGVFEVYFVVNRDDAMSQHTVAGMAGPVHMVLTEEHGYPKAVNVGIRASNERLIAIVNDDVKFHNGWWDGLRKALTADVMVVATNDLSPHTANGDACTQPIVRRTYITSPGGAWGEPGIAMHEGYTHNFSETELWQLALHRGVGRFAPDCVIEHVHPNWHKAEVDDTYINGSMRPGGWEHDHALFLEREVQWQSK
jgi:glycosyltransferase involved in cell wall biosynthesis